MAKKSTLTIQDLAKVYDYPGVHPEVVVGGKVITDLKVASSPATPVEDVALDDESSIANKHTGIVLGQFKFVNSDPATSPTPSDMPLVAAFTVDASDLAWVGKARSSEFGREPLWQLAYRVESETEVELAATNSYRLHIATTRNDGSVPNDEVGVIPGSIAHLAKFGGHLQVSVFGQQGTQRVAVVTFEDTTGARSLIIPYSTGAGYIGYQQLLPTNFENILATGQTHDISGAIKALRKTGAKIRSIRWDYTFDGHTVDYWDNSLNEGTVKSPEVLALPSVDRPFRVNYKYLADAADGCPNFALSPDQTEEFVHKPVFLWGDSAFGARLALLMPIGLSSK